MSHRAPFSLALLALVGAFGFVWSPMTGPHRPGHGEPVVTVDPSGATGSYLDATGSPFSAGTPFRFGLTTSVEQWVQTTVLTGSFGGVSKISTKPPALGAPAPTTGVTPATPGTVVYAGFRAEWAATTMTAGHYVLLARYGDFEWHDIQPAIIVNGSPTPTFSLSASGTQTYGTGGHGDDQIYNSNVTISVNAAAPNQTIRVYALPSISSSDIGSITLVGSSSKGALAFTPSVTPTAVASYYVAVLTNDDKTLASDPIIFGVRQD